VLHSVRLSLCLSVGPVPAIFSKQEAVETYNIFSENSAGLE